MSHSNEKSSTKEGQSLSRRDALKTLAALGGAATFSVLPNKWETPVVKIGSLPAFAQATPSPVTISNASASARQGACDPGGGQNGDLFTINVTYADQDGQITANQAKLRATLQFMPSGSTNTDEVTLQSINISGDASNGTISVPLCLGFGSDTSVQVTIFVTNANGSESNSLNVTISNPNSYPAPAGQNQGSSPSGRIIKR
jgi:hypothetical protein